MYQALVGAPATPHCPAYPLPPLIIEVSGATAPIRRSSAPSRRTSPLALPVPLLFARAHDTKRAQTTASAACGLSCSPGRAPLLCTGARRSTRRSLLDLASPWPRKHLLSERAPFAAPAVGAFPGRAGTLATAPRARLRPGWASRAGEPPGRTQPAHSFHVGRPAPRRTPFSVSARHTHPRSSLSPRPYTLCPPA